MSFGSSSDHGTLFQLRNLINRTNVIKDPTSNFNACDDYFNTVVSAHIIAALNELDATDFNPTVDWMKSDEDRKKIVLSLSTKLVDRYVDFSYHSDRSPSDDSIQEYAIQLLSLGCFYKEFSDAIKEGDGNRILRCWRYLLPIFWNSGRTNYSGEVFNMLYQHDYLLSPAHALQLLWSRSINVHGRPGKNVPADLHLEHLNRTVKECIKGLGANKTDQAIKRVGYALGTIVPVLEHYDLDNDVPSLSGAHTQKSAVQDLNMLVNELSKSRVFSHRKGRKHQIFSKPRIVLHGRSKVTLNEWMIAKIKKLL